MLQKFMNHVSVSNLSYGTIEEFNFRAKIFENLDTEIDQVNAENQESGQTLRLAHNKFSTWTQHEMTAMRGYKHQDNDAAVEYTVLPPSNGDEKNWINELAVTAVKDQGQCGSCWSFSTVGAVEGNYAVLTGSLEAFAEQQLVSCNNVLNHGCRGGSMTLAFMYLQQNSLAHMADYPYTSGTGLNHVCDQSKVGGPVKVQTINTVTPQSADQLQSALDHSPVSVAIDAQGIKFQTYSSGVLMESNCGTNLDHGVLAVGYGTWTDGTRYYIVKNSWGAGWGDHGFIKIEMVDGPGACGIQLQPVWPTVKQA